MPGKLIATPTIVAATTVGGPTNSSAVNVDMKAGRFPRRHVGIGAPASLDGTVTVQVDQTSTGDWIDLAQDGSTAPVEVPAGSGRLIRNFPFPRLRLRSSTDEASNRDFRVWLQ